MTTTTNPTPLNYRARMRVMQAKAKAFAKSTQNAAKREAAEARVAWAKQIEAVTLRLEARFEAALAAGDAKTIARILRANERIAKLDAAKRSSGQAGQTAKAKAGKWQITLDGVTTTGSRARCGNAYRMWKGLNPFYSSSGVDALNCVKLGEQYPEFLTLCQPVE